MRSEWPPTNAARHTGPMSLVVVARGGSGIAMAADSKVVIGDRSFDTEEKLVVLGSAPILLGACGVTRVGTWNVAGEAKAVAASLAPDDTFDESAAAIAAHFERSFGALASATIGSVRLVLAGYSPDDRSPHACTVVLEHGSPARVQHLGEAFGLSWYGSTESLDRIVNGVDVRVVQSVGQWVHARHGGGAADAGLDAALASAGVGFPLDAMPLASLAALVGGLVDLGTAYHQLLPGLAAVGGPRFVATLDATTRVPVVR